MRFLILVTCLLTTMTARSSYAEEKCVRALDVKLVQVFHNHTDESGGTVNDSISYRAEVTDYQEVFFSFDSSSKNFDFNLATAIKAVTTSYRLCGDPTVSADELLLRLKILE